MVTYRGYKTYVQYDHETAFATGGTPNTSIKGRISSVTINKNNNLLRTQGLGDCRNETFAGFGNFDVSWSMEYELGAFDFLQFAIGSTAGTIGGSGTAVAPNYLEEADFRGYSGAGAELYSFALEVAAEDVSGTDNVDTLSGCVINTVGFSLALGQTLKCSIEGFARSVVSSAAASAFTPDTTDLWIFSQGNFTWDGTDRGRVQSITVNISNNYDPEQGREIGSRFPEEMEPGLRKYDFVATMKMTSDDYVALRDDFYGQANSPHLGVALSEPTAKNFILTLSQGVASGNRNARILLSEARINDLSKPINIGDNIIECTVNGTAKQGTTDTTNKPIKWWTIS